MGSRQEAVEKVPSLKFQVSSRQEDREELVRIQQGGGHSLVYTLWSLMIGI